MDEVVRVLLEALDARVTRIEREVIYPRLVYTMGENSKVESIKRVPQDLEIATEDEVRQAIVGSRSKTK